MSAPTRNAEGYPDPTPYEAIKNMSKKPCCPTESEEQTALITWAGWMKTKYPELELLHAIPNGEFRHKKTAKALKAQGVKPGVPDICLPVPKRGYHGLYIELKRMTGRVTDNQTNWLNALKKHGYYAVVAYGFEEAKNFIEWYLGGANP